MILPYVVKLFDAPDVPLTVRRTSLETVDHFADYLDLTDYTSKIIHPLVGLVVLVELFLLFLLWQWGTQRLCL